MGGRRVVKSVMWYGQSKGQSERMVQMTNDMKESMRKEVPRREYIEAETAKEMMAREQMYRVISLQGGTQGVKSIV